MGKFINKLKKNKKLVDKYHSSKKLQKIVDKNRFQILLLTNRDSDNLGDQVIEACDLALINTVMKNLNIPEMKYHIKSAEASIISKAYLKSKDEKHLSKAKKFIKNADLVIIGGAPMFNYTYQNFYERTAVTIELAEKYKTPIIFSAIGIETYDDDNKKCQYLKERLNRDIVRQITTRDDFDALQKYIYNPKIRIKKVADPAVFSRNVFEPFCTSPSGKEKKIGLFVLRANGFKSNHIDFNYEQAANFWVDLTKKLKENGYKYELITSGHYSDEAFVDYLIREKGVAGSVCQFNMNTPEAMVRKISSYDAVLSCRLHPSIISYALKVPSIGLVWNTKVPGFYKSMGSEDRVIYTDKIDLDEIVNKIGQVIEEGVELDPDYQMTVYETLFDAIKNVVAPNSKQNPYTFKELCKKMVPYPGTTEEEREAKLKRKFRRAYSDYNNMYIKKLNEK